MAASGAIDLDNRLKCDERYDMIVFMNLLWENPILVYSLFWLIKLPTLVFIRPIT